MATQPEFSNRILCALPQTTLRRLQPALETVEMAKGQVIGRFDRPIEHIYFINRGLVSLVKTMEDGRMVEVGAVGIEGVTDPYALFRTRRAILDTIAQIPGTAARIKRETLLDELERDPPLREQLRRYSAFSFGQVAQTAACNRLHSLEERCCRWLLIAHDNADANMVPLTHEFLALMLGAQRAGISIALSVLRQSGLIEYSRGQVHIENRNGLLRRACECYTNMQKQMKLVFSGSR
jgi:CRP-like cAMP-binding protein